jgi:ABC-type Na+ efflux pump permease subunit
MKSLTIAIKDLTRSFRSTFSLIFMFGIPLLVTGMFFLMFGNIKESSTINIPATKVVVVNLDKGNSQTGQLGQTVVDSLQNEKLTSLMDITLSEDATKARQMVASGESGVAIIIPANFSDSFLDPEAEVVIEFLQDPTLTIGPKIVRSIVNNLIDDYAAIKITSVEASKKVATGSMTSAQIGPLVQEYITTILANTTEDKLIQQHTPASAPQQNSTAALIGPIMAGMMIFFAFFTGVNTSSSILREDEEGTLPRLFTTPTSQSEILRGKFIAVGLTIIIQIAVLITSARLFFGIQWGALPSLILAALSLVFSSGTFGILICAFMKNTKQSGVVFGGLLTVTGMLGMINIFTGNPQGTPLGIIPLLTPQGWVARSMLATMSGQSLPTVLPFILGSFAMSVIFFGVGVWRFQKRYA